MAAKKKPSIPFARKLVLNQWVLGLFGSRSLDELAEHLRDEDLEGLDEYNVSRLHHALVAHFGQLADLPPDVLLGYDQNIVRHTERLNAFRARAGGEGVVWKYFQYLSLLFTEIYLDRFFSDPTGLRDQLNQSIAGYNADVDAVDELTELDGEAPPRTQLNKLAFWSATGSGKTLLMHVNIHQYLHYLDLHGRRHELNRIVLLTPNEGLSLQHLNEFTRSGIHAELFSKDGGSLFTGHAVEIIDVNKLGEAMGDKVVDVAAFEDNNLVLVDEGHRGASSGAGGRWMERRNALCSEGFSFEYSATFGQAVKSSPDLSESYAKSILVDYSYRYFYGDGYGKDYQILNLDSTTHESHLDTYLTACLLTFFQQRRLFCERRDDIEPFNLESPLWVFVGGRVTASLAKKDASDIVEILLFLARYAADRKASVARIAEVLAGGLITSKGTNLFANRFGHLKLAGRTPDELYDESLGLIFNAPMGGTLHVENIKGVDGEIALRVGENAPFGVINVGDDSKLCKVCETHPELSVSDREFSASLFHAINDESSTISVLIGSKKFTEGWSSWRVSTMGLMNVGKSEGSQIIQLFGRGVRLRGYQTSLKRSAVANLPVGLERPKHIALLETLGVFGIHADYMEQFRAFLEEEGLPPNDERIEFVLPVIKNLGSTPLKTIRLQKRIGGRPTEFGDAFRTLGPIPTLRRPDPAADPATTYLQKNKVVLNWYPKIQSAKSSGVDGADRIIARHRTHLLPAHIAFLDLDRLFFDLERFKAERGWYNLNLTRLGIADLLVDTTWYELEIPEDALAFNSFEGVRLWQEVALALLKKYVERYYLFRKREWELPHLEYRELDLSDPNLTGAAADPDDDGYYRILIESSQEEIIAKLAELKKLIEAGSLKDFQFGSGLHAIMFERHLYQPMLYAAKGALAAVNLEIRPVPLNAGERQFVEDLREFHRADAAKPQGLLHDVDLYLLRNLSKGRGVGFFEAGNFHPDFIVWLVRGARQNIVFVDPKGIRNLGFSDPKILFFETVKEIEARLGDPTVRLDSFVVSNTASHVMESQWGVGKSEMTDRHILFQEEDRSSYVASMFASVLVD